MREACYDARDFQRQLIRQKDAEALEQLKEEGMEVTEISAEQRAAMQKKVQPTIDRFSQQIGPDFVKRVYAEIEKVRGQGGQAQAQ
jgi:TRAP-type C4-dicarboxylate transport system substrate-binding protein